MLRPNQRNIFDSGELHFPLLPGGQGKIKVADRGAAAEFAGDKRATNTRLQFALAGVEAITSRASTERKTSWQRKEDAVATIAAMYHVIGNLWSHHTRKSSHPPQAGPQKTNPRMPVKRRFIACPRIGTRNKQTGDMQPVWARPRLSPESDYRDKGGLAEMGVLICRGATLTNLHKSWDADKRSCSSQR